MVPGNPKKSWIFPKTNTHLAAKTGKTFQYTPRLTQQVPLLSKVQYILPEYRNSPLVLSFHCVLSGEGYEHEGTASWQMMDEWVGNSNEEQSRA